MAKDGTRDIHSVKGVWIEGIRTILMGSNNSGSDAEERRSKH